MVFAFFAIAFNIKKIAAKIRKQRNMSADGGTFGLYAASYTPVWDVQRKNDRKNAKIAA